MSPYEKFRKLKDDLLMKTPRGFAYDYSKATEEFPDIDPRYQHDIATYSELAYKYYHFNAKDGGFYLSCILLVGFYIKAMVSCCELYQQLIGLGILAFFITMLVIKIKHHKSYGKILSLERLIEMELRKHDNE